MDITGSRILPGERTRVWTHLTSPESLALCIPGCESVAGSPETGFDLVVSQKIGFTRLSFAGTILLSDIVPAARVTLTGRGKGGVAGHAHGSAGIRLADHADGTELAWDLGALVQGRIARFGTPVIRSVATRMTQAFLDRLDAILAAECRAETP